MCINIANLDQIMKRTNLTHDNINLKQNWMDTFVIAIINET
jgi:hypothetical protein